MPKIRISTLLWLLVVIALCCGWYVDRSRQGHRKQLLGTWVTINHPYYGADSGDFITFVHGGRFRSDIFEGTYTVDLETETITFHANRVIDHEDLQEWIETDYWVIVSYAFKKKGNKLMLLPREASEAIMDENYFMVELDRAT